MSLMIYQDGVLAADRCAMFSAGSYFTNKGELQKLYVSEDRRLAVTFVGDALTAEEVASAMELFKLAILNWIASGRPAPMLLDDQARQIRGDRAWYVMTTEHAFFFERPSVEWNDLNGQNHCRGNGGNMGYIGLAHGLKPAQCIRVVAEIHAEVGHEVDECSRSYLLPLINTAEEAV